MPGGFESLNAAVAAGILLFEVVRQRNSPIKKEIK
jgi:tRNA G18 (ribose-2'-O)-methylase SpoU